MEARATLNDAGVSKSIVVMLAVSVALASGTAGAIIAKNLTGSSAAPATHIAQVKSVAPLQAPASGYTVHRGGLQAVEDPPVPANSFLGPDAQDRNSSLGTQAPFRESHGY